PSIYSRPRLSRKIAPRPSTKTSGSCSGAHHSRMLVNGCQTKRLSAAMSSSVFHSVILSSGAHASRLRAPPDFSHGHFAPPSISQSRRRLRPRRAAAGIFAREFLLALVNPRVTGDCNTSSQHRRQFSIENTTCCRISLLAIRASFHRDLFLYYDS